MNERVKELRKSLGLSQEAFANRIGLKGAAVSLIENGQRNITDQFINSVCREFNVNEDWLRSGVGSMYSELSRSELAAQIVGAALGNDDDFITSTFIALGQLTPAEWDVVRKFVDKIKSSPS